MKLTRVKLVNFKNCPSVDLQFDQKVNIIYGYNGSGKTNFLDALHFLSVAKSYFGLSDKYLVRSGQEFYRLEGHYEHSGKQDHLVIKYKKDQKRTIALNAKKIERVQDLIGRFPIVLIAPDDINIVKGGSKDRRDYFNKWLCQFNKDYLQGLINYNRILRQKDALLKGDRRPSRLSIQAYNFQLVPLADQLHLAIETAMMHFVPAAIQHYKKISNQVGTVAINRLTDMGHVETTKLFEDAIDQEIMARRPLVGIQRDEYEFLIDDQPFKKYGSQGQIKSLLYSLRLSEFNLLREQLIIRPLLALDDFFEKLDNLRLSSLLSLISKGEFGQVFLSDTEIGRSKKIFRERGINYGAYLVEKGDIRRIE